MNRVFLGVMVGLLALTAGCGGTGTPSATPEPVSTTTATPPSTSSTTTTHQIDRYLKIDVTAFGPINVSVRIKRLHGDGPSVVDETQTLEVGDSLDYTDELDDGTEYLVVVTTPEEEQRHILRNYQAITFIIKDGGTIEREMDVE